MAVQAEISRDKLKEKIGKILKVIIDKVKKSHLIGRTSGDAPEIDGQVIIKKISKKIIHPCNIVTVRIEKANDHDLFGTI